jgi:hypothetical protein
VLLPRSHTSALSSRPQWLVTLPRLIIAREGGRTRQAHRPARTNQLNSETAQCADVETMHKNTDDVAAYPIMRASFSPPVAMQMMACKCCASCPSRAQARQKTAKPSRRRLIASSSQAEDHQPCSAGKQAARVPRGGSSRRDVHVRGATGQNTTPEKQPERKAVATTGYGARRRLKASQDRK